MNIITGQSGLSKTFYILTLVIISVFGGYWYGEGKSDQVTQNIISALPVKQHDLDFDWPPRLNQPFPNIELVSHTGEMVKLLDFKGKVILVEPMGMTCAACNAFSGAKLKGGYKGISYQQNLPPIESLLPQYASGTTLDDERLVLVQLLLYDMQLKAPIAEDARKWAEHFGLDKKRNVYILAGDEHYVNKASYDMIPGFFLIDKDFILRSDSTGHNPKHNLYTELFAKIPWLLQSVDLDQAATGIDVTNDLENSQFTEKFYAALDLSMPVERAYRSIPHKQTTFNAASAKMEAAEMEYLYKLFSIVDAAIVERVQTLLWYQTKGRRGVNNNNYDQILTKLEEMDVPANLKKAHELIKQAISEQNQYFKEIDTSKKYSFNANDKIVQTSHAKLIRAYSLLMALFPQENSHNKESFYDHLCALDFI